MENCGIGMIANREQRINLDVFPHVDKKGCSYAPARQDPFHIPYIVADSVFIDGGDWHVQALRQSPSVAGNAFSNLVDE
jgi:hypothetical protein